MSDSDPVSGNVTIRLGDLWDAVRGGWYLVLMGALLGAASGVWVSGRSPTYEARAMVEVEPAVVASEGGATTAEVNIATEQQIARSGSVLGRVVDELENPTSLGRFAGNSDIQSPPGSNTLILSVRDTDPEVAAENAATWAEEYLGYRKDRADESISSRIEGIDAAIAAARETFLDAVDALNLAAPGSVQEQDARAQRDLAEEQLGALLTRRSTLETTSTNPGRILSTPQVPREPEGFGGAPLAVGGAILGGLVGAAVAILLPQRRRVVRSLQRLPKDLRTLVMADLTHEDPEHNRVELAALVERIAQVLDAETVGLVLVQNTAGHEWLGTHLRSALTDRGISVDLAQDPRDVRHYKYGEPLSLVVLTGCRDRDPWLAALAQRASLVLPLVETGSTQLGDVRATTSAVTRSTGHPPSLVLVPPTEQSPPESTAFAGADSPPRQDRQAANHHRTPPADAPAQGELTR